MFPFCGKFMSPVSPVAEGPENEIGKEIPSVSNTPSPLITRRSGSTRPSASSSQSSTLTNGSSPPSGIGLSIKETKEKKNREKMLAGSEFSLTGPDFELDFYDYNVQNAEPGSYLAMDPAFCLWIPPFAPGIWNEETEFMTPDRPEKSEKSDTYQSSEMIFNEEGDTSGGSSMSVSENISASNPLIRKSLRNLEDNDSTHTMVERLKPDSPIKVHQAYRIREKETRVEKSPSGSDYYELLESSDVIKYADDDEEDQGEPIFLESETIKTETKETKTKRTLIAEVHQRNNVPVDQ